MRLSLGIDPSTTGFYYAIIRDSDKLSVLETGFFDADFHIARGFLLDNRFDRIGLEMVSDYIRSAKLFRSLIHTATCCGLFLGAIEAARQTVGWKTEVVKVNAKVCREAYGIGGTKDQDAQVKATLQIALHGRRPKEPWNNHVRDAALVGIYALGNVETS